MENYKNLRIEALYNVLYQKEEYVYRTMCRYIAKEYHIPLNEVEQLPVNYVLRHYYETLYENFEEDKLYKTAVELMYPQAMVEEEKDIQDFIKKIETEAQAARAAKQSVANKQQEKSVDKKQQEPQQVSPTTKNPKLPEFNLQFNDESDDIE
jgi:hypothetical protein